MSEMIGRQALVKSGRGQANEPMYPNVIVARLSGGLGNQLFQYAAGLARARATDAHLVLDASAFSHPNERRRLALQPYTMNVPIITEAPIFDDETDTARINLPADLVAAPGALPTELTVHREPALTHDAKFSSVSSGTYMIGYWQSARYFEQCADEIEAAFTLAPEQLDPINQGWLARLRAEHSVAVHVRRGDFLKEPHHSFHGECSLSYYRAALDHIRSQVASPQFFVFSDDTDWCASHFTNSDTFIVSHNGPDEVHCDLALMASCRHHVIANSSLSWWGAFLGRDRDGIVIAPVPWFTVAPHTPERYLSGWTKLNRRTGGAIELDRARIRAASVSVVVPAHERPAMLAEAVSSVAAQSKKPLEIIISLSAPTLDCRRAAEHLAERYGAKVISNPAPNLGKARNAGIAAATGEWIAFLDDDDIWLSEKLERQVEAAVLTGADLVSCDFVLFDERGDIPSSGLPRWPDDLSLAEALTIDNYVSGGSAAMIRAEVARKLGGFDETMVACEDHDLWRRVAWKHHIVILAQKLVRIRRHGSQMVGSAERMRHGKRQGLKKTISDTPPHLVHMLPAVREKHRRDETLEERRPSIFAPEWRKFSATLPGLSVVWNVAVYAGTLTYFGVPAPRTLPICLAVFVSTCLGYGSLLIFRIGVALLIIGCVVLTGLLPPPAQLRELLASFLAASRG